MADWSRFMMRISSFLCGILVLLLLPGSAAAGVTYVPGPTNNETFVPGVPQHYTLPSSMDQRCASIDCKYVTNMDNRIGYCEFGRGQDMLLAITITDGEAQTYTINVSTWDFEPSEITITTGSTLIFNVTDNSSVHNIVLPWTSTEVVKQNETPGFGFDIVPLTMLAAVFWIRVRSRIV